MVQINGKIRDKMMVPADLTQPQLAALAETADSIKALTEGKQIVKVIAVPKKLINIVVK